MKEIINLSEICKHELDFSGENISEYIGIVIKEGKPEVIFPRGFNLSSNNKEIRKEIILLIKVLNKYSKRKESKIFLKEKESILDGEGKEFPFKSAIWLINDYENNGIYRESYPCYKIDKTGNINWNRTLKTQIPYTLKNRLIYMDFVINEKREDINNQITIIQMYVIEKCIKYVGWLYPNIYIEKGNKLPFSNQMCINILTKELRLTNNDNKKLLLKNMINFLKYTSNKKSDENLTEYKTKKFECIWEDMLSEILGNEDVRKYNISAKWCINGNVKETSKLRPDVILKKEKKIYVIDAKYYKYGITEKLIDLPQSSDITKQFIYSSYIKSNFKEIEEVYDAFILPYNGVGKDIFCAEGSASIDITEFFEKKVICILADTKEIMKQYINPSKREEYRKNLIELIDKENFLKG